MKTMIEYHILQNFAPSNINRDDTGSPKEAIFGGHVRGRISSQSMKRAYRTYVAEQRLLDESALGVRTLLAVQAISTLLVGKGRDNARAGEIVEFALASAKLGFKDGKSQYLLFLGKSELEGIATAIDDFWTELDVVAPKGEKSDDAETAESATKKTAKAKKNDAKAAVPSDLAKRISAALDGGKAVDIALFGRMIADSHDISRDAACQVAHAISTNRIEREFDFFTAVDDLQPKDNAGAGMLGTVEFNSSCYYRYGVIDVRQLIQNLGGDGELAFLGIAAFLRAIVDAKPTGKQNTFAAHQPPEYVCFGIRNGGVPVSFTNAFEKPVRPTNDVSLINRSAAALHAQHQKLDTAYKIGGSYTTLNLTGNDAVVIGTQVSSLDQLIDSTISQARTTIGVK